MIENSFRKWFGLDLFSIFRVLNTRVIDRKIERYKIRTIAWKLSNYRNLSTYPIRSSKILHDKFQIKRKSNFAKNWRDPLLIFQQSTLSSKSTISITVRKFNVPRLLEKSWKENCCSQGGRVVLVPNSTHRCDYLVEVESWKRPRFARDPRRGTDATDAFQWDARIVSSRSCWSFYL